MVLSPYFVRTVLTDVSFPTLAKVVCALTTRVVALNSVPSLKLLRYAIHNLLKLVNMLVARHAEL